MLKRDDKLVCFPSPRRKQGFESPRERQLNQCLVPNRPSAPSFLLQFFSKSITGHAGPACSAFSCLQFPMRSRPLQLRDEPSSGINRECRRRAPSSSCVMNQTTNLGVRSSNLFGRAKSRREISALWQTGLRRSEADVSVPGARPEIVSVATLIGAREGAAVIPLRGWQQHALPISGQREEFLGLSLLW